MRHMVPDDPDLDSVTSEPRKVAELAELRCPGRAVTRPGITGADRSTPDILGTSGLSQSTPQYIGTYPLSVGDHSVLAYL